MTETPDLYFPRGVRTSTPFASLPAAVEWINTARADDRPFGPVCALLDGSGHPFDAFAAETWTLAPVASRTWPLRLVLWTDRTLIAEYGAEYEKATGDEFDSIHQLAGYWLGEDTFSLIAAQMFGTLNVPVMLAQYRRCAGLEDAARRIGLPNAKDRRNFGRTVLRPIEDALDEIRTAALHAVNDLVTSTWIAASNRSGEVVLLDDGEIPRGRSHPSPAGRARLSAFVKGK